jgi:membrane protease YdiL (CAAX protease family)
MRALGIIVLQILLAVLVSGLILPLLMFSVPQAREAGNLAPLLLAGVLFALVRVAWPSRKQDT